MFGVLVMTQRYLRFVLNILIASGFLFFSSAGFCAPKKLLPESNTHQSSSNSTASALAGASAPSIIPFRKSERDDIDNASGVAIYFVSFLGLLALVVVVLKKTPLGQNFFPKLLKVLPGDKHNGRLILKRQISLTSKNSIHLVQWNNEELLIACSDQLTSIIARRQIDLTMSPEDGIELSEKKSGMSE